MMSFKIAYLHYRDVFLYTKYFYFKLPLDRLSFVCYSSPIKRNQEFTDMAYYEFHLTDHRTMNEITYLFPDLQTIKNFSKQVNEDYETLFNKNASKVQHAMAAYHEYVPYFEGAKMYYDEQYREMLKTAWELTISAGKAYQEKRIEIMALVFTPKLVSGLGQY